MTKGMCGICYGTLTDETIYVDEDGQRWDVHRGVCALLSGRYPDDHTARALGTLIELSHEYAINSDRRKAIMKIYYELVHLIADEDHYATFEPV
ncbi:hypothetical protein JRC04_04575 [Mycolicibacterium sp. S2-37]|nr:hypothetical protein [Mycolicibacterium sp. S2-37]